MKRIIEGVLLMASLMLGAFCASASFVSFANGDYVTSVITAVGLWVCVYVFIGAVLELLK